MSANYVLAWIVAISALRLSVVFWRSSGHRRTGLLVVQGVVLAVLAIGLAVDPSHAGFVAAGSFVLLYLLPAFAGILAMRLVVRQHHDRARPLLRIAALLPGLGVRELRPIFAALALLRDEKGVEARTLLAEVARSDGRSASLATMYLYRIDARWEDLRRWVDVHPRRDELLRDLDVQTAYLSSLGETGDRLTMVRTLDRVERMAGRFDSAHLALMRLHTAAMNGRRDTVERLVRIGPLHRMLSPTHKTFWLATADQVGGNASDARSTFAELRGSCEAVLRAAVDRRLARPLVPVSADELDLEARATLDRVSREVRHESTLGVHAPGSAGRPVVTHSLALLLVLVFLCELPGGSTDARNLHRLGALVVPLAQLHGEWWRLGTAIFLHYGPIHLAMNLLGLFLLGSWLERLLGRVSYLVAYAFAGLGASMSVLLLATFIGGPPQMFLGASGAIMGILGATAAVHLRIGRREDSGLVRRSLRTMLLQVVLQTCFDLATPSVSMAGHVSGLLLGFAAGCVLRIPRALTTAS